MRLLGRQGELGAIPGGGSILFATIRKVAVLKAAVEPALRQVS